MFCQSVSSTHAPFERAWWSARASIEQHEAEVVGGLLALEARFTFYDGATARKRWVRLLYQGHTQVRLVAQAASVEGYAYWEPMFYEAMRTLRFGDWFG